MDWAAAADVCNLTHLRLRRLTKAARQLTSSSDLPRIFALADTLGGQRPQHLLPQLLGLVSTVAARGATEDNTWPTTDAAAVALQQAANPGSFE